MRYFLEVARTEHMTRSAERLHVAQPALSRSIARLEQELGTTLFERKGRGMRLTPQGHLVQKRLEEIVRQIDDVERELAEFEAKEQRTVRVRMLSASRLAVEAISAWMTTHPDAHIELVQADDADTPADVTIESSAARPFAERRCFTERIMLAVPAQSELADGPVSLQALSGCSFVSLAGSYAFRHACDDICRRYGFVPAVSLESDIPDVVRKIIALDLGVGFWPEHSWGDPGDTVRLVHVAAEGFERQIFVSLSTPRENTAYAPDLYDRLCEHLEQAFEEGGVR